MVGVMATSEVDHVARRLAELLRERVPARALGLELPLARRHVDFVDVFEADDEDDDDDDVELARAALDEVDVPALRAMDAEASAPCARRGGARARRRLKPSF